MFLGVEVMMFDKNIKEFPTMLHRDIYMTALRMTPPEVSLGEIEKTNPALVKSGWEFYAFMIELLADMYNNPCLYGMNPGAYENFMNGRKYFAVKRKQTIKAKEYFDKSNAELFSYLGFLKEIAIRCKIVDSRCLISVEDFEKVKIQKLKKETALLVIPNEIVIKMFEQIGLRFTESTDGNITMTNDKYPHMFMAMSTLGKAVDNSIKNPISKNKKYLYAGNYGYLEFRQILRNYKPVYEDLVHFLPDSYREMVELLCEMADGYKMSKMYGNDGGCFGIDFQYKGKLIMRLWLDVCYEPSRIQKNWIRGINLSIRGSLRLEYQQNVEKYGEDFIKYFRRHLNYCGCCNPDHVVGTSGIRQVLGKNVRICSEPGGIIKNPKAEDLPYIKKYIDLRIEEVLAGMK